LNRSQVLLRTSLFSSLTLILYFFSQVPLLNLAAVFLLPVPMILIGTMHGFAAAGLGTLLTAILMGSFLGLTALVGYLPFAVCALVLGVCFHRRQGLKLSLSLAFLFVGIALMGQIQLGIHVLGLNHQEQNLEFEKSFSKMYEEQFLEPLLKDKERVQQEYADLLGSLTSSVEERQGKKEELDRLLGLEKSAVETKAGLENALRNQEPFLGFFLLLYLMVQVSVVGRIGTRLGIHSIPGLEFSSWKLPVGVSWLFLGLLVCSFYLQDPQAGLNTDKDVLIAVGYATQLVYFLFGMSITSFLLGQMKISAPVKIMLVVVGFIFSQALVLMVMFLGIFDSFFNFRQAYVQGKKGA